MEVVQKNHARTHYIILTKSRLLNLVITGKLVTLVRQGKREEDDLASNLEKLAKAKVSRK